jgi:hypothetical protein
MSNQTLTLVVTLVALAVLLMMIFRQVRRALKRGTISYSGNRSGLPSRLYSRTDSPRGFWTGIAILIFVAAFAVLIAAIFILAAFGMNI